MIHKFADKFEEHLIRLEMVDHETDQPTGLFFVEQIPSHPSVHIALEQAKHYRADAVLFRMFPEDSNRAPRPQIYIYNNTSLAFDGAIYAELHRRLWNAEIVPLVFIFTSSEIKVFNCRREPNIDPKTKKPVFTPFSVLEKMVAVEKAFVTRNIVTGTIWDNPEFKDEFSLERTAYHKLLNHLKSFRDKLVVQGFLSEPLINRLLVMAILVKYLDDRQDNKGNRVFAKGFFRKFSNQRSDKFSFIFRERGACTRLFEYLSRHFNGSIFELNSIEQDEIEKADLTPIADFLEGDREPSGQGLFWPLYSFEDLPVELISNIYEEFLAKRDSLTNVGVVYTPPMLVDFLLDQCLPLKPEILDWKIVDPACGSGVFLVGAFKRLIHCWKMANNWSQPTPEVLKELLKNNIYGFDKEAEAILIAVFSLCVALCNELDPLVIWNKLKLDNLRNKNLLAKDFFEIVESQEYNSYFDLVIGNPPFESSLKSAAAERLETHQIINRPRLPDKQIALLFLEQSFTLCKNKAQLCLVQPAGPLLYNINARDFRNYIFKSKQVNCIFDFTPLEGILFKAKVATAAILATNKPANFDRLPHITFRRTRATKEKIFLELDPYDIHWISYGDIFENPFVWKINLLGGGRLHRLMRRFHNVRTLGEYLDQKILSSAHP